MADEYMKYKLSSVPNCGEEEKLGQGGFGTVFKANVQRPGLLKHELCAVKRISNHHYSHPLSRPELQRELLVSLRLLQHEWFLQFFGWYQDKDYFYFAMEYIELGDLEQHMGFKWSEEDTKVVASQLLEGVMIMHAHGIIHRDLKPANVFPVVLDHGPGSTLRIKIGDFGISKPTSNNNSTMTYTGTMEYMAPEIIEGMAYSKPVDLWALGCILYKMTTGRMPFFPGQLFMYKYGNLKFPWKELEDTHMSKNGIEFINQIMEANPESRLTAQAAMNSDWILSKPPGFQITGQLTQHFMALQVQHHPQSELTVIQVTQETNIEKQFQSKTVVPSRCITETTATYATYQQSTKPKAKLLGRFGRGREGNYIGLTCSHPDSDNRIMDSYDNRFRKVIGRIRDDFLIGRRFRYYTFTLDRGYLDFTRDGLDDILDINATAYLKKFGPKEGTDVHFWVAKLDDSFSVDEWEEWQPTQDSD